jgi:hypothetical protein
LRSRRSGRTDLRDHDGDFVPFAGIAFDVVDNPHLAVHLIEADVDAVVGASAWHSYRRQGSDQKQHRKRYFSHQNLLPHGK